MKIAIIVSILCVICCLSFVSQKEGISFTKYDLKIPEGVPLPIIPEDNQLSKERVSLGKMLFYDKILSSDKSISCASCHSQATSFSDNRQVSLGVKDSVGKRNAMPLINLAWSNSFFWDGGVSTLELQVLKPLTSHNEMNSNLPETIERLNKHKIYRKLFIKAYGSAPDANTLFKAIASFERTLISFNSKYDRRRITKDASVFTNSETRGYFLFNSGKTHCTSCHSGVLFTNNSFQNNGLYEIYTDLGRFNITGNEVDNGKFKVPSLRNLAFTAPYMHDGSLKSLYEVVDHYNNGGKLHPNKSPHVHNNDSPPLTMDEKIDLVSFLNTLTDDEFVNNPEFKAETP